MRLLQSQLDLDEWLLEARLLEAGQGCEVQKLLGMHIEHARVRLKDKDMYGSLQEYTEHLHLLAQAAEACVLRASLHISLVARLGVPLVPLLPSTFAMTPVQGMKQSNVSRTQRLGRRCAYPFQRGQVQCGGCKDSLSLSASLQLLSRNDEVQGISNKDWTQACVFGTSSFQSYLGNSSPTRYKAL